MNKGNEFEDRDNDDDENEDEEDFDECETISDDSVQLPEGMTAEERERLPLANYEKIKKENEDQRRLKSEVHFL